jgi:hypothetical protein
MSASHCYTADAHKWLFSPKGSAMLWVTRAAQRGLHPAAIGAVCSNSPSTQFRPEVLAGRGLHSSTFRLNVSAFCGIGGPSGGAYSVFEGVMGIMGCFGCILCQKRLRLS